MQLFAKEQARMREQMQQAFGGKDFMDFTVPMSLIEETTRRNIQMFQEAMRFFAPQPPPAQEKEEKKKEEPQPQKANGGPTSAELQELREQLAAMQRKIDSLTK